MKISDIRVYPLGYIREVPTMFTRSFALVRVETDAGLSGWGEASDCYGHSNPRVVQQVVEGEFKRHLLGKDPLLLERHIRAVMQSVYQTMGLSGAAIQALSAVEIALWDIRGKVLDQPIHRMLGSYRDRVSIYAAGTIAFDEPAEWHAKFFEPLLERGCRTVKVRIGKSLRSDVALVGGIRGLLGDEIDVIVDGKYNYTLQTAIKLAHRLEEHNVLYLEEPIPEYDLQALATLAQKAPLPIAYGEHAYTVHDFRALIAHDAASVFQPDATLVGGLLEARKVCTLAEAWGIDVSPHCGGLTAVGIAANLQLSAASPTLSVLEYDASPEQPLRDQLPIGRPFSPERVEQGRLALPEGPGLGIVLNEDALNEFPYRQRGPVPEVPSRYGSPHI